MRPALTLSLSLFAAGLATTASTPLQAQRVMLPPAIEVRIPKPPSVLRGDGQRVLVYELHVTNLAAETLTLSRVEVLGDGSTVPLAAMEDSALRGAITRPGVAIPPGERGKIAGGLRAVVFMWVGLANGVQPPTRLHHRLTLRRSGADSGAVSIVDAGDVPVSSELVVIAAPLRGSVWLAANGPSPTTGHRRAMIAVEGGPHIAQRFAIDYLKINAEGQSYVGDRLKNSSYMAYGNDALAVADASVVAVKDGIPENVPGSRAVPITLETVGGNHVILDLGNGLYAFYAHLQPGSIRVRLGDKVKTGQVLGLVGNSGNSTEPHLHFHISDANSPLGSEGVPYVHQSLQVLGRCAGLISGCTSTQAVSHSQEMPMANQLIQFPK